ncbi:MAG: S41 family peptidase [Gemmatimonadota bacterium]|jgi:carboxyl-terminal processing protease
MVEARSVKPTWRESTGIRIAAVLAFVVPVSAGTPARARAQATAADRYPQALALATFDSAWTRIRDTHYDTTFNGVDWNAVRAELRPQAASVQSLDQLRTLLRDMLARLGESHYGLIPGEAASTFEPGRSRDDSALDGDLGLELRDVDGRLAVWRVDPAGPAGEAGVRPGWFVTSIDDFKPGPALEAVESVAGDVARRNALTQMLFRTNGRLDGPIGSRVRLGLVDGSGEARPFLLVRRPRPGVPVTFGNLPTFYATLDSRRLGTAPTCVGVIRFNVWMVPLSPKFDDALDSLRDCRGIVLDLRGNPGGVAGMVMGVAGHFFAEPNTLGTMRSRGTELNFVANPRRVNARAEPVEPFSGRVAILVDLLSVSTSEIFAGGMQALGRARVFGENSAGQALPATLLRLPNGDVLMHVVADFTMPGGIRIEGRGIRPDEAEPLHRSDLLAGTDAPLEAALHWIRARPDGVSQ